MSKAYFKHSSALIDKGANIGTDTKIWHFSHIMGNSVIGSNCILGQNSFVASHVRIGNGVKIQNNVSIYEGVEVQDDVFIGPSVVFTNVIRPRAFIEQKSNFKKTIVKKGATIGANATIVCGVSLGEYSMIAAGSVVTKNTPPYSLFLGVPAKQVGWVSQAGEELVFNESNIAHCSMLNQDYKLLDNKIILLDKK